jgi:hypothetical protein
MSEESNIVDIAEAAQKKGKFNLADAIKNRAYPEKSVDIYLDSNSAFKLDEVNKELQYLIDTGNIKEHDKLRVEADKLVEEIKKSKLTFHMRGVGQSEVERITEEADRLYPKTEENFENPDWIKFYLASLIASNIVKVTDAEGQEDDTKYTVENILEIRGIIPIDSWEVLIDTMQKLTLAGAYFDAITDAGFLPKS